MEKQKLSKEMQRIVDFFNSIDIQQMSNEELSLYANFAYSENLDCQTEMYKRGLE